MISVVAIDIDGTLVAVDGSLPERNKTALEEATRLGTLLVLATARSVAGANEVLHHLGLRGAVIAELGATVIDVDGSTVMASRFPKVYAIEMIENLSTASLHFVCTSNGVNYESSDSIKARTGAARKLNSSSVDYSEVSRIVIRQASPRRVREALGHIPVGLYVGAVGPGGGRDVILVPPGVSKDAGLASLCRYRGVERSNVLAIGDSLTDASLLEWAGYGVAVADGDPSLLAKAVWIAPPAANGGVADALVHFAVIGPQP